MSEMKFGVDIIHPMKSKHAPIPTSGKYVCQKKYNGTRCLCYVIGDSDRIALIGKRWKNDYAARFPEIVSDVEKLQLEDAVLDCELTYFDKDGRDVFKTALAKPESKRGLTARLMVFDVIRAFGEDMTKEPLNVRLEILAEIVNLDLKHVGLVESCFDIKRFGDYFNDYVEDGGEGVVVKHLDNPYVQGERIDIKHKAKESSDCIVIGYSAGTGKRTGTFGALFLGQFDAGGKLVYVGKVGTGFDDAFLDKFGKRLAKVKGTRYPLIKQQSDVQRWIEPEIVVEVISEGRTEYGILWHPAFIRVRDDKDVYDCVIEEEQ